MLMLWYGCVALMAMMSTASATVGVLDFITKRRESRAAREMGGYVTHGTLLAELKTVYEKMAAGDQAARESVKEIVAEIKEDTRGTRRALEQLAKDHERLEGQLNPIELTKPTRRRPLPG